MSKSKTKTKTNSTVTPTNPGWVTGAVSGLQGRIGEFAGRDPLEFVAPASSLQKAAYSLGGGLADRMAGGSGFDWGSIANKAPADKGGSRVPVMDSLSGGQTADPIRTSRPLSDKKSPDRPIYSQPFGGGVGRGEMRDFGNIPDFGGAAGAGGSSLNETVRRTYRTMPTKGIPSSAPINNISALNQGNNAGAEVTPEMLGQVSPTELGSPDPSDFFTGAGLLAGQAGLAGSNTVSDVARSRPGLLGQAAGYDASGPAGTQQMNSAQLGDAAQYGAAGPAGTQQIDPSLLGQASGYGAAGPAGVFQMAASLVPGAEGYDASTYGAAQVDPSGMAGTQAAQLDPARINALQDPYNAAVVDATMADFDERAGQVRAGQAANAARGAFGGSRYGISEAQTEGELSRARASTMGGLLSDGYRFSAGLAESDAGRRQQAGMFNADMRSQGALANLNADMAARGDNAAALNAAGQFNAGSQNAIALANQAAQQEASRFSGDALNRMGLDFATRDDAARRFSSDAQNEFARANQDASQSASMFNAGESNRSALDYAARGDAAGQFNTAAQNEFARANQNAAQEASRFNAGEYNQSQRDYVGRSDTANQYNVGEQNRFGLTRYQGETDANFRNADAVNDMNRFNAGQQDAALMRQLSAAGLLGDLGSTVGSEDRANIGLLSDLGNDQREIDSAYRNADPTMMQLIAQLQGQQNYGLFRGQNSRESGTSSTSGVSAGDIAQAAQAGAILFSDERLKENIRTTHNDAKGRRWVEYNYKGDPTRKSGVIAQEVAKTDPHAVAKHSSGFLTVDYSKLD